MRAHGDAPRQRLAGVLAEHGQGGEPAQVLRLKHGRQVAAEVEQVEVADRAGGEQFVGVPEKLAGGDLCLVHEPAAEHQPARQPAERGGPTPAGVRRAGPVRRRAGPTGGCGRPAVRRGLPAPG